MQQSLSGWLKNATTATIVVLNLVVFSSIESAWSQQQRSSQSGTTRISRPGKAELDRFVSGLTSSVDSLIAGRQPGKEFKMDLGPALKITVRACKKINFPMI